MINYSFVIPHKNSLLLLKRCIDSIPHRPDVEIIVVDDVSREEERPSNLRDDVSVVLLDSENSNGAGKARNIGLNRARGKWILFADCDDFYEDGFINKLDEYVCSSYDIVFFDAYFYYSLNTKKAEESSHSVDLNNYIKNPGSRKFECMLKHCDNAVWSRMYSKAYLDRIDAFFEERKACNDGWFVQYTSANTDNIAAISEKLYYYVKNEGSTTFKKQSPEMYWDRFEASCKIRKLLVESAASCALPRHFPLHFYLKMVKNCGFLFLLKMLRHHFFNDASFLRVLYWKFYWTLKNVKRV
jgi:glycosyltransferase involved in cell wall biosynthesis